MPRVLTHDNNLTPEKLLKILYVVQLIKNSNEPKFHQISLCKLLIIMGQNPMVWSLYDIYDPIQHRQEYSEDWSEH